MILYKFFQIFFLLRTLPHFYYRALLIIINMNYSATERSLFLGDLSVYCTEQDIFEIFQSFGPIESIQLKRKSVANGRPSYGFVQFRFRESAEEALRVMNGRVIHGRAIR